MRSSSVIVQSSILAIGAASTETAHSTTLLAFAHREGPTAKLHPQVLGDLVISIDTARKQAKRGLVVRKGNPTVRCKGS